MKYLSLFSGIGGFELPLERLGHECVGYSEIDENAIKIYKKHFPNHKNYGDIKAIDDAKLPDFDLLTGGFPCPSFSIAGKKAGFADERGQLFFDVVRIIKAKKPTYFILENVRNLLSHDKGKTFQRILDELGECGYTVQWLLLNSQDFGVAQQRRRVFIIGSIRGISSPSFQHITESNQRDDTQESKVGQRGLCLTTRSGQRQDPTAETFIGYCLNTKTRGVVQIWNETHVAGIDSIGKGEDAGFPRKVDRIRDKALGNAVTVNVIQAIMEKLL